MRNNLVNNRLIDNCFCWSTILACIVDYNLCWFFPKLFPGLRCGDCLWQGQSIARWLRWPRCLDLLQPFRKNITKEINLEELKETHLSSPMCLPENTNVRINRLQFFICHLGLCALIDALQELQWSHYQRYFIQDPAMCDVKVLPRYWNEQFLVVLQHNPQVREQCSENRI